MAVAANTPRRDVRQRAVTVYGAHPIVAFALRRLISGVAVLFVAALVIFIATNALPGGVAEAVLGKSATPSRVSALNHTLGLNRPLLDRFFSWIGGAVHGNLGQSELQIAQGATSAPVTHIIGTPLFNSLILGSLTAVFLFPAAMVVGMLTAVRAGRRTDVVVSYTSLVLGSLPEFVLGTFLILIFASEFKLLPSVALVPPGATPFTDISILILPAVTLFCVSLAFASRQVRAGMIEVLKSDYVAAARLAGLPERRVLTRYALRNALATSIQTFAQTLQYLFGGIIVVEALFAYPGIGDELVTSVSSRDLSTVQGVGLVLAALYILINIVADVLVVLLVPRLRTGLAS